MLITPKRNAAAAHNPVNANGVAVRKVPVSARVERNPRSKMR